MNELEAIVSNLTNAERNALAWVCRREDTHNPPHGMLPYLTKLGEKRLVRFVISWIGERRGWEPTEKGVEILEIISRG